MIKETKTVIIRIQTTENSDNKKGEKNMRRNFFRGVGSLFLAMFLVLTSAQEIFAATQDIIDTGRRGSFTIYKYDLTAAEQDDVDISGGVFENNGKEDIKAKETLMNYAISGVEFTYLQLGGIHTDSQGGKVQLLYDIPESLEKILELENERKNHCYTSTELNKTLKDIMSKGTEGKNKLEQYMMNSEERKAMPVTDTEGKTAATGLSLGLYLILETRVPANVHTTIDPFFVSLPMTDSEGDAWFYDVEVYPKNQTDIPDLDKLVKQKDDNGKLSYEDVATGSEGDVMDYILVSHLPQITSEATYLTKYSFVDKMDTGLVYNKDVTIRFYDSEADARENKKEKAIQIWDNDESLYQVSYIEENNQKMTVTITKEGLKEINTKFSGKWIVIDYSCSIKSDQSPILGDSGNINNVNLEWKRTNMEEADTLEDRAKVYTFGLNIKKNFADNKGNALDVQFVLQNQTDGHYIKAKGENGIYYVTDSEKGTTEKEATVLVPAEDGNLEIYGLEANTYVLTEIATSDGYSLLKKSMVIDIVSTLDNIIPSRTTLYDIMDKNNNPNKNLIETEGRRASASVDGKPASMSEFHSDNGSVSINANVELSVVNSRTFQLPQTGGLGTWIFTFAGCGAALVGVILVTKKSKKKEV